MAKNNKKPYSATSLLGFQSRFPLENSCWNFLYKARWPDGFQCPHCKSLRGCFKPSRKTFECYDCKKQTSITAQTIFHKSHIPLRKWFWEIFLIATSNKSVSALYLQKQLGIGTYRATWMMMQKIRQSMSQRDELYKLQGIVEADEILIGGKQSLAERREEGSNKTPFLIMV